MSGRVRLGALLSGEVVRRPSADLYIDGDVSGLVEARSVLVSGDVLPGAGIFVSGGGASIIVGGAVSDRAVLVARGGGAEVVVMGNVR